MEQEGNGKKKGSHQLQRFNDNEEEREWGSRWMDRRKREGESAKIDRLSVIPRQSCVCMCVCVTWWSLETVCVCVCVYVYVYPIDTWQMLETFLKNTKESRDLCPISILLWILLGDFRQAS